MNGYSIRNIISKIQSGEIRIPSFQRDYVWDFENVTFLMDSIYKGFPIGSILFWRTKEQLKTEKMLGNFELPAPQKDYPIDYVLDGQQRLTSLFTVFQSELKPTVPNEMEVYFIIEDSGSIQKSRFISLLSSEIVDRSKYFPISALFDSVKYRQATSSYDDDTIVIVDKLQEIFKEFSVPFEIVETDDKEHVSIVFERINRAGIPLNSFQLFTAWSWSEDFDLQDELTSLATELSEYGFDEIINQQDLLLKCFTGVILGNTSPKAIMELDGTSIREAFVSIKNGIKSSIDFLQKELNVYTLKILPYPSMIVALTRFFASTKTNGILYDDKQRAELVRWFWRSCFSRRYSSGVNDVQETDIANMVKLRHDSDFKIADFKCIISPSFFIENQFTNGAVNTKAFILLLSSRTPRSFISGAKVDLKKTLKGSSSREFHHIFPDKHLQRLGLKKKDIYCLANFCFLNNADNQKIKDRAPLEYKKEIVGDVDKILSSALCPTNALDLVYDDFIKTRADLLVKYASSLI